MCDEHFHADLTQPVARIKLGGAKQLADHPPQQSSKGTPLSSTRPVQRVATLLALLMLLLVPPSLAQASTVAEITEADSAVASAFAGTRRIDYDCATGQAGDLDIYGSNARGYVTVVHYNPADGGYYYKGLGSFSTQVGGYIGKEIPARAGMQISHVLITRTSGSFTAVPGCGFP